MADDVNAVVDEVVSRVKRRLEAFDAGKNDPCSTVPAKAARDQGDCADSCNACPNHDSCGTVLAVKSGVARISPDKVKTSGDIAQYIDHTLLKPDATKDEVLKLCDEARRHSFATVCLNSSNIGTAARALQGSRVVPIAVVGFPLGAALPTAKAFETREAIRCGAKEIDTVINIGALKAKDYALVLKDLEMTVAAAGRIPVKVILETSQLTQEEKIVGCALSKAAGAAFVKTSTGFGGGGATVEDIVLMRKVVGDDVGVKASGGIRSTEDAMKMIAAGANRLGASASVAIVTGGTSTSKY